MGPAAVRPALRSTDRPRPVHPAAGELLLILGAGGLLLFGVMWLLRRKSAHDLRVILRHIAAEATSADFETAHTVFPAGAPVIDPGDVFSDKYDARQKQAFGYTGI